MKLSHLSDQALLQQTLLLVKREKEILSEILDHLEEVRRRRLFCDLGYGSLFQYCVKHLGYSEDQAYRRTNALKIVKEIPIVREQIASGELSLASLSVAQSLFKSHRSVDKKALLGALAHKSKREAEVIVREFAPQLPELKKEVKLALSSAQEEKWQSVKAKLAHCNLSEAEILERLCDFFLAPKPKPKPKPDSKPEPRAKSKGRAVSNAAPRPAPPRNAASAASSRASIPADLKRQIFHPNKCSNCNSIYALEIDHKLPRALGGTHHRSNLRLLCRSCNQRAAIQLLGAEKMQRYLDKS